MCAPGTLVEDDSPTKKSSSSSSSFADQTISISAGRLVATLAAVALAVFLATAHFYADHAGIAVEKPSHVVPLDIRPSNPNRTSRTVLVKRSNPHQQALETVDSTSTAVAEKGGLNMGNVASEVGIVIALQAIFPVVNRVVMVARRVKWASVGVRIAPSVSRVLKVFGDVWHKLMLAYKKTSASKIVTRTKKMVKLFKHHDDEHHHDDDAHDHNKHGHKGQTEKAHAH